MGTFIGIIILVALCWGGWKFLVWFVKWVLEPVIEEQPKKEVISVSTIAVDRQNNGETVKVEIKDPKFDSNKIQPYQEQETKQFEFRPQNFGQFIGQKEAKERATIIMKKAKRGIRCHFLVDGIKGHGKTTFVELVAKTLGAKIIHRIGKQVEEDELLEVVNEINESTSKYVMLFIDEIDTMDWKIIKILNPIIEQFKINERNIRPFIFAGATINKHILIKNNPDTLDRIPTHIKFARYDSEEIGTIVRQYRDQLYPVENVSEETIKIISENCKFNPRTSISLLEEFIVTEDIKRVLKSCKIIKEGLTDIDIVILKALSKATRPMGANALAMKCKLSQQEYLREFEPFLVEYDYVNRVPSRVITEKGKEVLDLIECP